MINMNCVPDHQDRSVISTKFRILSLKMVATYHCIVKTVIYTAVSRNKLFHEERSNLER